MSALFGRNADVTVPSNLYNYIDDEISGPGYLDDATFSKLSAYADDDAYEQSLAHATQASNAEMMAAVPTQNYIDDTRESLLAANQNQMGPATNNKILANLVSAQCVKLPTCRINGYCMLSAPDATAEAPITLQTFPYLWANMINIGVQCGTNGCVVVDEGLGLEQLWKNYMFLMAKNFREQRYPHISSKYLDLILEAGDGTTKDLATFTFKNSTPIRYDFSIAPNHHLFRSAKLWPPNLPMRINLSWDADKTSKLFISTGAAANLNVAIAIDSITVDEVFLNALVKEQVMANFEITPLTNINAINRGFNAGFGPSDRKVLMDPTFGIRNYDPSNTAAIFQYKDTRIQNFNVSGTVFDLQPVQNGSARPTRIIIAFTSPNKPMLSSSISLLKNMQIMYDGRTLFHKPYGPFELYRETMKTLKADAEKHSYHTWASYVALDQGFIVVDTGPSRNENEINPARATQISLKGEFNQSVSNVNVRVTMVYDQTMTAFKNNEVAIALPLS